MLSRLALTTAIALAVAGCGGGGGGSAAGTATATGIFKDSNTGGLKYVSGGQSGTTGADGSFTYEVGKTVTFSIGGVTLGAPAGKSVVTPIDLVAAGSSGTVKVQNIVRFLMMLDSDANPANGLTISPAVQAAAATWLPLDFGAGSFATDAATVIASVSAADNRVAALPAANTAQTHLESTLRCAYAGAYKGTYAGTDNGKFGVMVDVATGHVVGVAYSVPNNQSFTLSGTTPVGYNQTAAFVSGVTSSGATYSGQFTSVDSMSGTWQNAPGSGSFSGSRIGGALNAAYRFTGQFSGTNVGLFTFDVDNANAVTGIAYNIADDRLVTLSGTLAGTTLTATTSTGTAVAGTLNITNGSLTGTWNGGGGSGSFSGSGCKLN